MQNHPRISAGSQLGICPHFIFAGFFIALGSFHLCLSGGYIRRSLLAHHPVLASKVYRFLVVVVVWCYPSGVRELSALAPFQGFAIALKQGTPPQGQGSI
ncbi:MAG: hypothetical protein IPQ11_10205 [Bacteroidetes bacterium]|nr:hypothetical protein [Bacteroidota bacterium]